MKNFGERLTLKATAVGSLPHSNPDDALELIFNNFREIPFWPQLGSIDRKEDMIIQYNQGIPGIRFVEDKNCCVADIQSDEFFIELEEFFLDYESIINDKDLSLIQKYSITAPFSSSIKPFLERLRGFKYAKGHVTGPFTWGTSLCDEEGRCSFYDETFREVLTRAITLKAVWQITEFKKAVQDVTPIIFIDEPALSQFGTSAFVTVQRQDIINSLSEISKVIQSFGGLCAVHCCGKADWSMLIESDIDIISIDGYTYAKSLAVYSDKVEEFLNKGGYIAWGMVPTLDKKELEKVNLAQIKDRFTQAVSYLTDKGLSKELIMKQSFFTPACGAGSLSVEMAKKAMNLTIELSEELKKENGVS